MKTNIFTLIGLILIVSGLTLCINKLEFGTFIFLTGIVLFALMPKKSENAKH